MYDIIIQWSLSGTDVAQQMWLSIVASIIIPLRTCEHSLMTILKVGSSKPGIHRFLMCKLEFIALEV